MITEAQVVAALPRSGFLREYVRYAASCTDAHAAFHVGVGLSILAQTVPPYVKLPYGPEMFSNLFVLIVGDSTEARKTQAIKLGKLVLQEAAADLIGERPGSWEGLVDSLRDKPQQIIFLPEFSSFLAASEHGYLTALKTNLTDIYDCGSIGRRTVGSKKAGHVEVKHPRMSILAGCAPGYLERHTEEVDWTDGYLARFFTLFFDRGASHPGTRTFDRPRSDDAWQTRLSLQLRGYIPKVQDILVENAGPQACGDFTPEANLLWKEWTEQTINARENASYMVKSAISRAQGMAVKIASLLTWDVNEGARTGGPWAIDADALNSALQMVSWHIDSVVRIGQMIASDRDMRDRRRVLSLVNGAPMEFGELIKKSKLLKRRCREIIETLCEERSIVTVTIPGDARTYYRLPAVDDDFTPNIFGQ